MAIKFLILPLSVLALASMLILKDSSNNPVCAQTLDKIAPQGGTMEPLTEEDRAKICDELKATNAKTCEESDTADLLGRFYDAGYMVKRLNWNSQDCEFRIDECKSDKILYEYACDYGSLTPAMVVCPCGCSQGRCTCGEDSSQPSGSTVGVPEQPGLTRPQLDLKFFRKPVLKQ